MKLHTFILGLSLLLPASKLFGQTGINQLEMEYEQATNREAHFLQQSNRPPPLSPEEQVKGIYMDLYDPDSQTNMTFIVHVKCPPEYTNVLSNTNLFSSAEQNLLTEIPLIYKNVTTNSGPPGSVLTGLNKTNGYYVAFFQYTNSGAMDEVTFSYYSNVKSAKFRTASGDGYNIETGDINGISILNFDSVKHGIVDGLSASVPDNHCIRWMHFANGKAVNRWFEWGAKDAYFIEIKVKAPVDYFKYLQNIGF
jgi:hypothetical protein